MNMSETKKITLSKYEVSVIGMLVITLLPTFGVLVLQIVQDIIHNATNNYRIYFVTGVVFVAALVCATLLCRKFARELQLPRIVGLVGMGVAFVGTVLLLAKCYLNSSAVYPCLSGEWFPWHSKANLKMFVFMTGISIIGILVTLWAGKQRKLIEVVRYPAYLLASGIAGFSMYCGNFLASDKMHGNAYYTSVYNALVDAPYDYSNRSIYGHYAIFLKYPIKFLGGDYTAFNIVISIVGGISLFMLALALDKCLENHFISIIGVWSISVMYLYYPLNHWQMFPHRVVFAGIELYLLALLFHKKSKWIKPIGYVVCSLSLLWNIETGIVCLGVWALAVIVQNNFFEKKLFGWKVFFVSAMRNVAYSILSIMGMVVLFNLYNMPLGERWHGLRFLLFPHISTWDMPEKIVVQAAEQGGTVESSGLFESVKALDSGFASGLSTHFPLQISPWYFVFLLMGLAVILVVVRKLYRRDNANDYVMGLTAILALGHLVYFANRPCFDYLAIAYLEAILIMGILADEIFDRESAFGGMKKAYQLLIIGIMSVLSVLSVWQFVYRFAEREEIGYYSQEEFDNLLNDIRETVPEDTLAFGQGIQEIYAQLGWDTGCYFVDYSSLGGNEHSVATIVVKASEQSECLISVREKNGDQKITAQQYMRFWGFAEDAITIKKQWEMGMDSGAYWDIYYIGIDQSIENSVIERYSKIYYQDKGQYE